MKHLKFIAYSVVFLFITLSTLVAFLFTTTPGLHTTLRVLNLFIPGKIQAYNVTGSLAQHVSFTALTYADDRLHVRITKGDMHWLLPSLLHHQLTITNFRADTLSIRTNITTKPHHPIKLPGNLQINQLAINRVSIQHQDIKQAFTKLQLNGSLNHKQWIINQLSTNYVNLHLSFEASGQSTPPYALAATLKFTPQVRGQGLQGNINITGNTALYHWQGRFNGPMHGDIDGTLKNGLDIYSHANWYNAKLPSKAPIPIASSQGNITIKGTLLDMLVESHAMIEAPMLAEWQMTARIKNKQANLKSTLHLTGKELKTTVLASAVLNNAQNATLNLIVNPGTYQLPEGSPMPTIAFKGGELLVAITPQALQAKGKLTIDEQKKIELALRIPKFRLNTKNTNQAIDGKLSLHANTLDFLQTTSKTVEHLHGQLNIDLTTKGTLAKPIVTGALLLTNSSLSIPKSGLVLSPIQATLHTSNNHWQAESSIMSGERLLTLKGQGDYSPHITGELNLQSEDFPIIKTAQYTINVSPQLAIKLDSHSLNINGNILIPSAQLKPISFGDSVNLPDDVVFINGETAKSPNPFNITTNVQLKMGKKVALDIKGLRGFLEGSIQVKQQPKNPMSAMGELTIREGKYRAYGQDLNIEQGQLLFTGGPIDNPGINIRAIRKFNHSANDFSSPEFNAGNLEPIDFGNKTTVGIQINGRLNSNKVKLFSVPANLSQSDILSMLILGKPASQANKSGGQLLLAAISSMNLDSGTKGMQLLDQLKQKIGVDFNIQSNTLYNQQTNQATDKTALVVGKSLTKRIYVSYNIGLLQTDSNVLTLKYLLNKFFSIQVNASDTASGVDLLFTHRKD